MKKILILILSIIVLLDIIDHNFINNLIYNHLNKIFIKENYKLTYDSNKMDNINKYKDFSSNIKNINDYTIKEKNDILNIYYTILNNGLSDFTFYCDNNYKNCFNDISEISNNNETFSYLNSLIHPYNSFKQIHSSIINNDRIDVKIDKKYTNDEIETIENKINELINTLNINNYDSISDKMKVFHDYIINTNKYDTKREQGETIYHSDSAIGTLFEGYSICSGYTDTMAIFLNKLGIDNIRMITNNHTWNAIKLDNTWYHIDLTWDDPVNVLGRDILSHDYFMLSTSELLNKDLTEHNFDKNVYNFIK